MELVRALLRSENPFARQRLGYGGFLGRRYPYFYMETPKAACTATKVVLWRLENLGPLPRLDMVHERSPWDPRLSPLTVPEDSAVAALSGGSMFRFFIWRDPVDRLRSAWYDKIHLGRDPSPEWDRWRGEIRAAFGLKSEQPITFDHFAEFVCAAPDESRDHHFMSQRLLLLSDYIAYHYAVRTDDYARGMAEVLTRIGVPKDRWPPLDQLHNHTGSDAIPVSEATAGRIRDAYKAAYDLIEAVPSTPRAAVASGGG